MRRRTLSLGRAGHYSLTIPVSLSAPRLSERRAPIAANFSAGKWTSTPGLILGPHISQEKYWPPSSGLKWRRLIRSRVAALKYGAPTTNGLRLLSSPARYVARSFRTIGHITLTCITSCSAIWRRGRSSLTDSNSEEFRPYSTMSHYIPHRWANATAALRET